MQKKCHGSVYKMHVNGKLLVLADCGCRAPAAGTWPTPWRRTRRRPSTAFSPGHWGRTGGGVSPASSGSGTSCGLASAIGPPSAKPAAKRQFGADFVSYRISSFFSPFFLLLFFLCPLQGHVHMALPLCVGARALGEAQRRSAALRREDVQPAGRSHGLAGALLPLRPHRHRQPAGGPLPAPQDLSRGFRPALPAAGCGVDAAERRSPKDPATVQRLPLLCRGPRGFQ